MLALQSEAVSHSVLAVSAACLCIDMMECETPNTDIIRQTLASGLRHHTKALGDAQTMLVNPTVSNVEYLLGNSVLLVPFAFAFEHINHWLICNDPLHGPYEERNRVTPRDAIVLLRGLKSTLASLDADHKAISPGSATASPVSVWDTTSRQGLCAKDLSKQPSRTHTMFPVLAATGNRAFHELRQRVEDTSSSADYSDASACAAAFRMLNSIRNDIFSPPQSGSAPINLEVKYDLSQDSLLAQVPTWLRSYVLRPAVPYHKERLARSLIGFFFRVPDEFLDLLFPLLDQQAESPMMEWPSQSAELSPTQALALDIYAHWLVLMFLIEKESWWVGSFPVVALEGIIERYPLDIVRGGIESMQDQWWPAIMLRTKIQLNRWK